MWFKSSLFRQISSVEHECTWTLCLKHYMASHRLQAATFHRYAFGRHSNSPYSRIAFAPRLDLIESNCRTSDCVTHCVSVLSAALPLLFVYVKREIQWCLTLLSSFSFFICGRGHGFHSFVMRLCALWPLACRDRSVLHG